jgi:hypothetical protein
VTESPVRDLVCLVADKNIEQTLRALLATRPQSLNIRAVSFEIYVHPESDPACSRRAHDFLRPFVNSYSNALVVFDREGSGQEQLSREDLEEKLEKLLTDSGWAERAAVVAIDPEIEAWVWSRSPHVAAALGWHGKSPDLVSWLIEKDLLAAGQVKPGRPKESMERALREVRKPRSSSIYYQLAQNVGLTGCKDPSFIKLRSCLARWFPLAPPDHV